MMTAASARYPANSSRTGGHPAELLATAAAADPEAALSQLTRGLGDTGWAQQDNFVPPRLVRILAAECRSLDQSGALKAAGIGHGQQQQTRPAIRGDHIGWLRAGQTPACDQYLQVMNTLRMGLNRTLWLGLDDFESHFACYAPSTGYARHLDCFRDDACRTISAVLYLNQDWLPHQGGALRLHLGSGSAHDIAPVGGRLVLFLSAAIEHEVRPATRARLSLAGWFRRRPL